MRLVPSPAPTSTSGRGSRWKPSSTPRSQSGHSRRGNAGTTFTGIGRSSTLEKYQTVNAMNNNEPSPRMPAFIDAPSEDASILLQLAYNWLDYSGDRRQSWSL